MKKLTILIVCISLCFPMVACRGKKDAQSSYDGSNNNIPGMQSIYFDFDQSSIRSDQVSVMNQNGDFLKKNSKQRVTIEGNCDARGTNEYNLALGDRRARAAQDYIINLGIQSSRLSTVSYGEEKPSCNESSESCWSHNRRDDFTKGQ